MQTRQRIAVVGAGGFARETALWIQDMTRAGDPVEFAGFVVSDLSKLGPRDSRDRLLGDFDWLASHRNQVDALALGVGTPELRLRLSAELKKRFPDLPWPALIHPSVWIDRSTCTFGEGVFLCPGLIATVNITFEPFVVVNAGSTVGHEARIGRGSVINTANVSGGVDIGVGVLVGAGAQILQYLSVGDGAVVGAGAVVTKNVDPKTTVVGIPAKPLERNAS